MESEIMEIDPRFWIMIDFDDLLENTMDYAPIFALCFFQKFGETTWNRLEIERRMSNVLSITMPSKTKDNPMDNDCTLNQQQMDDLQLLIDSHEWTIFNGDP